MDANDLSPGRGPRGPIEVTDACPREAPARPRGLARRARLAVPLLVAGLLGGGCASGLQEQVSLLNEENTRLRSALDERGAALDAMQRDLEDCRGEQVALRSRNAELEDRLATAPVSGPADAFGGIPGVESSASGGMVTALIEGDVLFASGQTNLRSSARSSLDQVARVIRDRFGGMTIRVTGHTDTDPIRKSKDRFPTNYHLGFERAFAVREYLVDRGIPASSISIESYGPHRPAETKQKSRRVEIAVVTG